MVNYTHSIKFDGQQIVGLNTDETIFPVLQYEGSTYIPLPTVGELMGQNASWDGLHWTQTDASLKALSVISYDNIIYLPLRNLTEPNIMKIE